LLLKEKLPSSEDPDVLEYLGDGTMKLKIAEFFEMAMRVDCVASLPMRQQINFRAVLFSGIRFNQVISAEAGEYVLSCPLHE